MGHESTGNGDARTAQHGSRRTGPHRGIVRLADWDARRMGISDHEDAFNTPWLRIWQCRKNDIEEAEYNERYQKIKHNLSKPKTT